MNIEDIWFSLDQIKVIELGRIAEQSYHPFRTHPNFCVLGIVFKGQRTVRISDAHLTAKAGEYFLLPEGYSQSGVYCDEHDVCFVHFIAEKKLIRKPESIDSEHLYLPIIGTVPTDIDCFKSLMYVLSLSKQPQIKISTCNKQLEAILQQLSIYQQRCAVWGNNRTPLVDNIIQMIHKRIDENLTYKDFETAFGMSYKHLNNLIVDQYNKSIKQLQVQFKMDLADILLRSKTSIEETAEAIGYNDYFYFIKFYKKHRGITPGQMQKQF